ncbi:LigB subunit of aromatic ring-opening dioxygenase, putative [Candida maltosa Xu316]|uniref:LigB subunit of aromatic ring-opening dioxygenase, putative n=1 Tax=Candida maltosa (strain Xu316) TaxID=1245528 RepID=M3HIY1_CANMX|nr:LigB subunit of aromatic ring-opening dioxygenase, putative [Candida maltosa Xu316]
MTSLTKKIIQNPHPFPTYFFSHGGPTFMYELDDFGNKGAWKTVKKIGTNIKKNWKPDYIIVVSAHWQSSGSNLIEINFPRNSKENPLIYDFYGFPDHMYKEEFHSENNLFIVNEIKKELESHGFNSSITNRGIDHGVWVPFKVAFSDYTTQSREQPETKGLDLPDTAVIQVSLTSSDKDFAKHFKLGEALSKFKNELIWDESKEKYLSGLVICSGMSVHNLRDLGASFRAPGNIMPYVKPFNKLLTKIVEENHGKDLLNAFVDLQKNPMLRQAHPTLEHFLPIVVAGGIASKSNDEIKELYNDSMLSLGWGIYQVGKYNNPKV